VENFKSSALGEGTGSWSLEGGAAVFWIGNLGRLVVHWERRLTEFQAFFHLACLLIALALN
jgi:hypothetical protein